MMTASITMLRQKVGGGDNGNIATWSWLSFHNRLMKLSYYRQSTTKMIDIIFFNTYVFAFHKK